MQKRFKTISFCFDFDVSGVDSSRERHKRISDINAYQFGNISFQNLMLTFFQRRIMKKGKKRNRLSSERWCCKEESGNYQSPPKRKYIDVCRFEILIRFFKWRGNLVYIISFITIPFHIISPPLHFSPHFSPPLSYSAPSRFFCITFSSSSRQSLSDILCKRFFFFFFTFICDFHRGLISFAFFLCWSTI